MVAGRWLGVQIALSRKKRVCLVPGASHETSDLSVSAGARLRCPAAHARQRRPRPVRDTDFPCADRCGSSLTASNTWQYRESPPRRRLAPREGAGRRLLGVRAYRGVGEVPDPQQSTWPLEDRRGVDNDVVRGDGGMGGGERQQEPVSGPVEPIAYLGRLSTSIRSVDQTRVPFTR